MYDHVWFWRPQPPPGRAVDRKGQRCRVLARGALGSVMVEFVDGIRVVCSRYAVRRINELSSRFAKIEAALLPDPWDLLRRIIGAVKKDPNEAETKDAVGSVAVAERALAMRMVADARIREGLDGPDAPKKEGGA